MTSTLERPPPTQRRAISFGTWVSAVIAAHMALWGTVMAGGWLYRDDFILQAQAARLGLTTALLLNNHDGHLMPATHLVVWVVQELGGLDYALVAGTMLIGQIVLVASAVTAFTALLGRGMPTLVALGVFLLSPIMLPGLTWWSSTLTLVPVLSCALLATATHIVYLRTGSTAALITTFALVVTSLAFFEKSLLIPLWLLLVTVLVDPEVGFWRGARAALTTRWRLWVGWLALCVAYLVAFAHVAQERTNPPTGPGQVFELVSRALFNTIGPGLVGGPVRWTPVDFNAAFGDPPPWVIAAGLVVGSSVVFAGVRRPTVARKAWVAAGLYLAADLATFAIGRLGPDGDPVVVQAGRYVATSMIYAVAIGQLPAHCRPRCPAPLAMALSRPACRSTSWCSASASLSPCSNPGRGIRPSCGVGNAWPTAADSGSPLLDQESPTSYSCR